jgi:phage host-nuclease inhibitor protein Gam
MPPTRRKAPRQLAPQTIEEATTLLGRYSEILTSVETLRADADAAIAQIEAVRDTLVAPIEEEAKSIFLQLRAWWGVAGGELTEGKRKSHELAGCVLGERTTPPSLAIGKMKTAEAVAALYRRAVELRDEAEQRAEAAAEADRIRKLVRTKMELDKPAILRELASNDLGPTIVALGFSSRQKEEFFIDRAAPKPAAVEEVADPAGQLEKAA